MSPDDSATNWRENIEPPSAEWQARNPGWDKVPPNSERWKNKGDKEENLKPEDFALNEDGIALKFAAEYTGKLLYCHHTGAWFVWTGTHWRKEETKLAFCWARNLCRELAKLAASDRLEAILSKAATAASVERYAQSDRVFAVTSEVWDADPWLIGTPGGTLDLRTGIMRDARPEDRITKVTAATPADTADCPRWIQFLQEATKEDKDLIRFLQQWSGYSLTGITQEHTLVFVYGPGGGSVAKICAGQDRTPAATVQAAIWNSPAMKVA